jgi:hypothetical protein
LATASALASQCNPSLFPPAPALLLDGHHNEVETIKKPFDFTRKHVKLDQSADRRRFINQFESAFDTPATVELEDILKALKPKIKY